MSPPARPASSLLCRTLHRALRRKAAALALACAGCAAPLHALDQRDRLITPSGTLEVQFAEVDRQAQRDVQRAVEVVLPQLERWGGLLAPVTLRVLPSHRALREAVGGERPGALRAYAHDDEVLIQSPRTWGLPLLGAAQEDLERLLLHELTHCVLFQQAAQRGEVVHKGIPFWFREGMATYTAREAFRLASLEDLARFFEAHPAENPLSPSWSLYRREHALVYGAAYHAFTLLVRRYREDTVRKLMSFMREGHTFAEAFESVLGLTRQDFEAEFRRYVALRGF